MTEQVYQKQCSRCKETKLFENFNRNRPTKDGYASECRECKKVISNEYYARLRAKGGIPSSLRKGLATCYKCGARKITFRKSYYRKLWQCGSCASKEVHNRPDIKAKASANAKAQIARQGGKIHVKDDSYKRKRGAENHSWKGGKPKCIDCGVELSTRQAVERCVACSAKFRTGENHPNWLGGKPHCKDCGIILSIRGVERCIQCAGHLRSGENHPSWKIDRPKCLDCGIEVGSGKIKRCQECHFKYGMLKGADNPNWQGGATIKNDRDRHKIQIRKWQKAVFRRDGYLCRLCREPSPGHLNAHHRKMWSTHEELRFDVDNGVTLCTDCHLFVHQGKFKNEPLDFWT